MKLKFTSPSAGSDEAIDENSNKQDPDYGDTTKDKVKKSVHNELLKSDKQSITKNPQNSKQKMQNLLQNTTAQAVDDFNSGNIDKEELTQKLSDTETVSSKLDQGKDISTSDMKKIGIDNKALSENGFATSTSEKGFKRVDFAMSDEIEDMAKAKVSSEQQPSQKITQTEQPKTPSAAPSADETALSQSKDMTPKVESPESPKLSIAQEIGNQTKFNKAQENLYEKQADERKYNNGATPEMAKRYLLEQNDLKVQ